MLNDERIYSDLRKFVSDLVDSGVETPVEWITDRFLASRGEIYGEGEPVYRYCTRAHLSVIAKKVVRKYEVEARAVQDEDVSLPGFEHLQRAYTVTRSEKIVLVPIQRLTDAELLIRAEEYDQMAQGCISHANEIRRFVKARATVKAA